MPEKGKRFTMNEKIFARQLGLFRREARLTQEELAKQLHVSPQAISKWENGHSLPETALLPDIARALDVQIDEFFSEKSLVILEALYGDGIAQTNVTKRLNRFVEKDTLDIVSSPALLGIQASAERVSYLTIKYQSAQGLCFGAFLDEEPILLKGEDVPTALPENGLNIISGRYGTKAHSYDVMHKIRHYAPFGWNAYYANHETFPSSPANDQTEYLSLVYLNGEGIHVATCAEGESLEYTGDKTHFLRRLKGEAHFIPDVPGLPSFGEGMECSWAAALTAALQAMQVETTYDAVMGNSGACYRLAFCSPGWDYSSVDGLVAYDHATPGYAAFGYTPEMYGHIEKGDRLAHRERIAKEIRSGMPVLGINLRVAPEWGVICGYAKEGEDLLCRTKYDRQTIENDPAFMKGFPPFDQSTIANPFNYLYADNWPFLLCYFTQKSKPPTPTENLLASLKIFVDCAEKEQQEGYSMGFKAYGVWAADLRDDAFYAACDDEQMARRFSVNQFCMLSLMDARKSAFAYLQGSTIFFHDERLSAMAGLFQKIFTISKELHEMLDSGAELDGKESRAFWTLEKRHRQAAALEEMVALERQAHSLAVEILAN